MTSDPVVVVAVSALLSTLSTVALLWANYMFPPGHHRKDAVKETDDEDS